MLFGTRRRSNLGVIVGGFKRSIAGCLNTDLTGTHWIV